MKGELTPKWKAFADEYIKNGGNGTQAYISAGYSENGANRSAQKTTVKSCHFAIYSGKNGANRERTAP